MKICVVQKNKNPFICAAIDGRAINLHGAYTKLRKKLKLPSIPTDYFQDSILFISNYSKIKKVILSILSSIGSDLNKKSDYIFSLSMARLMPPVPKPGSIYCLARNYTEHILEFHERVMEQDKMVPPIFIKPQTCVAGPGGFVVLPKVGRKIDWEAELAVIIGKKAKYVSREKALNYVFGYTCMLDISERSLKIRKRKEDRGRDKFFDWLNGKWMDTFAPQGPWITTRDEIKDPQNLHIKLSVNGIEKQNGNSAQMIFPVSEIISYLSNIATLMPGDIISTGTPSGVGAPKGDFIKDGDIIEMHIDKIGSLKVKAKSER